jgi:hypothetical protein
VNILISIITLYTAAVIIYKLCDKVHLAVKTQNIFKSKQETA